MNKNVLYSILIAFGLGILAGYLLLPTKIITKVVESEIDKKTIADLKQQLKQSTTTRTITLYKDGKISSVTTDTKTDTQTDTYQQTDTTEHQQLTQSEKIEINPKKYVIGVGYETNRDYFVNTFIPIIGSIGITGVISSNFSTRTSAGLGLAISF